MLQLRSNICTLVERLEHIEHTFVAVYCQEAVKYFSVNILSEYTELHIQYTHLTGSPERLVWLGC